MWPLKLKKELVNDQSNCNKIIDFVGVIKDFKNEFPRLFGPGPGVYNKGMLRIILKENAKPVSLKARKLPLALMEKIENEIDRLVKLKYLEKIDVSEWATPIVPVIKKDGSIRICGNFKLTLNLCLVIDRHPIPLIDEIFAALSGGTKFSQIDLEHLGRGKFEKLFNYCYA